MKPYSITDVATAWNNCSSILAQRSNFYIVNNTSIEVHALPLRMLTQFLVDEILTSQLIQYLSVSQHWCVLVTITNQVYFNIYEGPSISFQTFFIWALCLIVHTWNSSPLQSNLLRLHCPVSWGCRICRLLLCRGVRTPQRVSWIWH